MKKKFGAVLMAGVLACSIGVGVALTGCGTKAKADFVMPEDGFDTSKDVTITFYHQMGSDLRDILDDYIEQFEKMYPNIHVEHESQGEWKTLQKTITTRIQAGKQPNIAYCYADHVAGYNSANAVLTLNDFLSDGAFNDVTVPTVLVDQYGEYILDENGEQQVVDLPLNLTAEEEAMFNPIYFNEGYAFGDGSLMYTLPWVKSTEMMFYNKDFFEDPENIAKGLYVPTTWDEMEEVCAIIKEINPNATPFGYDSEENWFITMCQQIGSGYTSATGQKFLFDNDENKAFVERFRRWFELGYFTTQELSGSYTSTLFNDQEIYMSIGSTGGTSYNGDTSGSATFERGIAPVPQENPETNFKLISQGPSVCIFKSDDPQEVLASWLFVKYFTTNPLYQTEVSMKNGYMPVLSKAVMEEIPTYTSWIAKRNGSNYLTATAVYLGMEHENHYFVSPAFNGSTMAREQVGYLMQAAVSGTKDVDKAFSDALKSCVAKYGK